MIAFLLSIIVNVSLVPCDRIGMIPTSQIVANIEQEGTSYVYDDLDLFVTNDGEYRLYHSKSPFLHPQHGYLVQLVHGLRENDESYRVMLEAHVKGPAWCELPESRPRG